MVGAQVIPMFMYTQVKVRYDFADHIFETLKLVTYSRTTLH